MASVPVVQPKVSLVPIRSAPPIPSSLKITTLKDPETLESADDCPVIVWGDYRYWPLSYSDNRLAMCLVAYDLLNNVVNSWELTGARYVVTVTVNDSQREITLLGQSSGTVTVSWNQIGMVVPINPQYFWIVHLPGQTALYDSGTDNRFLLFGSRAVNDAQLWLVDNGRQAIFPKTSSPGMCLDHVEVSPGPLGFGNIYLDQTNWGKTQQRWIISETGLLKPAATTSLVATGKISINAVVLDLSAIQFVPTDKWYLKPYIPSPDLSTDQFPLLVPGESFTLSNQDQMLSSSGSGPLTLVPDTSNSARWLYHGDGVLVNAQNGLAITASSSSVIESPLTGRPEQQWSLTANGYLVCMANDLLMVGRGQTVLLSSYDPLGSADQIWHMGFQPAEASSRVVGKRSAASRDNITQLTVTARVSDDFWAGTTDKILISIGPKTFLQTLFDGPSRGDMVTVTIDLNSMFGKSAINLLDDVIFMSLWQEGVHPIASDAWKLASIILEAKDEANHLELTNYTFQKVDQWLDNHNPNLRQVWSKPIPWGAWLDADRKPVDLNGDRYPVDYIPCIGDLKSWRTYDPSTIDGVGQILGLRNGKLIGELLKPPRKTEVLQPSDDRYSYTWVFKPDGAIIYKLWDKQDLSNYTRHSQLGSGDPVICAGEMQMNRKVLDNYVVTDVIAMVNDASGHYKPDGAACLRYVQQKLQELDIPTDNIAWYTM